LLLKIPLNYLFIYGGFGIPAMGGIGCGWSTSIVMTYEVVVMALVVAFSRMRIAGLYARFSLPNAHEIWRLTKLGVPIGASTFLEFSMFSTMTLLIGRLGVDAVAAHMIASNVGGLTFMIPLALGMAGSIRVGYNVGAGDLVAARRSGYVVIGISLVFAVAAALAVFLGREFVAGLYTNESSVYLLATELLLFVAIYQLFDDTQVTAIGALRGYKDTRTPMIVAAFAYWGVGFPVSVILGFGLFGLPVLGVHGFWWGLSVGLAVAAILLLLRFRWLSHRDERVLQLARR
jgi:MATE family multidrug resistance protein